MMKRHVSIFKRLVCLGYLGYLGYSRYPGYPQDFGGTSGTPWKDIKIFVNMWRDMWALNLKKIGLIRVENKEILCRKRGDSRLSRQRIRQKCDIVTVGITSFSCYTGKITIELQRYGGPLHYAQHVNTPQTCSPLIFWNV